MDFVVPLRSETNSARYKLNFFLIEYKFGLIMDKKKKKHIRKINAPFIFASEDVN